MALMLDTIKLSQLKKALESADAPTVGDWVAGVEVDQLCFFHARGHGIHRIGFMASFDDDGELKTDVMDMVCHYKIEGLDVMVEVTSDSKVNLEKLLQYAATSKFHLSFLPPPAGAPADEWEGYLNRLREVIHLFFGYRNFSTEIHPVTGYIQYLMCEALGHQPTQISTDPYIESRFVTPVPVPKMDHLKGQLRTDLMDLFGGDEGLRELMNTLGYAITRRLETLAHESELLQGGKEKGFLSDCFINGLLFRKPRFQVEPHSRYVRKRLSGTANRFSKFTFPAQNRPPRRTYRPVINGVRLRRGARIWNGQILRRT
jgi:hypothetical protein